MYGEISRQALEHWKASCLKSDPLFGDSASQRQAQKNWSDPYLVSDLACEMHPSHAGLAWVYGESLLLETGYSRIGLVNVLACLVLVTQQTLLKLHRMVFSIC